MQSLTVLPNLNHLKYFCDAVELGSISASAQRNLVTHPAVSRAISAIERQMGVQLLKRKKKNFEVTVAGLQMARRARDLLVAADLFADASHSESDDVTGTVSIGVSRTIGHVYLAAVLKRMAQKYPAVKVNIKLGTTGELIEALAQQTVSIALTVGQQSMATIKQKLLRRGQFILIRSTKGSKLPNKDLLNESFILSEARAETELLKKSFFQKFKEPIKIQHTVESWDMIAHLVTEGLGIGLVPDMALGLENRKDLVSIKPDWFVYPYEIYLHQSKTSKSNASVRALVEVIESKIKGPS